MCVVGGEIRLPHGQTVKSRTVPLYINPSRRITRFFRRPQKTEHTATRRNCISMHFEMCRPHGGAKPFLGTHKTVSCFPLSEFQ